MNECQICFNEITFQNQQIVSDCNNEVFYHRECLYKWLRYDNGRCPHCRKVQPGWETSIPMPNTIMYSVRREPSTWPPYCKSVCVFVVFLLVSLYILYMESSINTGDNGNRNSTLIT